MIDKSVNQLTKVRQNHSDAAMLLVTKNQDSAQKAYDYIKQMFPHLKVILVHSDSTEDPHEELEKFENSDDHICICVDMVTEGVDIKRFRVITYATNKMTRLRFLQTVNRGTRRIYQTEADQVCYVLIPCHEACMRFAKEVLDEVYEDTDFEPKEEPTSTDKKKPDRESSFKPLHSEQTGEKLIEVTPDSTNEFCNDEVTEARRWMESQTEQYDFPTAIRIIRYLKKKGLFETDDAAAEDLGSLFGTVDTPSLTLEQRKNQIKNRIESHTNFISKAMLRLPDNKMWVPHKLYMELTDGRKQGQLTEDELKVKLQWIEDKRRNGFTAEEQVLINKMIRW